MVTEDANWRSATVDRRLEVDRDNDVPYGEVRFQAGDREFRRYSLPRREPYAPTPGDFPPDHCMKCGKPMGYESSVDGLWREERGVRLYNERDGDRFLQGNYTICMECVLGALGLSSTFGAAEHPYPTRVVGD
jgi:hypothetical protein